ncbi:MAG: NAD(P)H-flavin reductase [Arsenophonus sp.]
MTTLTCKLLSIKNITNTVYRIRLLAEGQLSFRAGQYLMVIMNDRDKRPFSLASIPSEKKTIELHISVSKHNFYAMEVIKYIFAKNSIKIDIPHGKAWFREGSKKTIILIAGGIGFSYSRSILYAALEENPKRNIILYWGGKKLENLYDLYELQLLSKRYHNIKIIPVVEQPELDWRGRTGTVLSAVLSDFCSLSKYEIYISGHFEMAKIAKEYFCSERCINPEYLYSDAFEFI